MVGEKTHSMLGNTRDEGLSITYDKLTSSSLLPLAGVLSSQMKYLGDVKNFRSVLFLVV